MAEAASEGNENIYKCEFRTCLSCIRVG